MKHVVLCDLKIDHVDSAVAVDVIKEGPAMNRLEYVILHILEVHDIHCAAAVDVALMRQHPERVETCGNADTGVLVERHVNHQPFGPDLRVMALPMVNSDSTATRVFGQLCVLQNNL